MRHISKGVEQGRRLQKVYFVLASVLLCDAQVQAVPQKLHLVMAMMLHGPKTPLNTGLPVRLFLEFLWEAQSRFWKKKILLIQCFTSGWVNATALYAHSWSGVCFSLAAARWISLQYYWLLECSSPERNSLTRSEVPPQHTKGIMVLWCWQPLLQKEFWPCKSLQRDLKCMLMGKKPHQ